MNKLIINLLVPLLIITGMSCSKDDENSNESSDTTINFRQEMRGFVKKISNYSKNKAANFIIIPQNGQELITDNGEANGAVQTEYLNAIDATGRESMFYGYYNDDEITPEEDKQHLLSLCLLCEQNNVEVLATDYCSTISKMDKSYQINQDNGFISFAANQRELNNIPSYPNVIHNDNNIDVNNISQAKNFLYIINGEEFASKQSFIESVSATNYDAIIMDLFHNELAFTNAEINQLKIKQNGAKRLVICYMSIGEAEDYRFYWKDEWTNNKPTWLDKENPEWEGNYKVKYWDSEWQKIIYGEDDSYLDLILNAGFDGVYLDIIDGFEYFEENE